MMTAVKATSPLPVRSDEAARRRRTFELTAIDRTYDGVRRRIIDQRDQSWQAAIDSSLARIRAAMVAVDVDESGRLTGPILGVGRAREVLARELATMPQVLAGIQERAVSTWADAQRVRDAKRSAYAFGGAE